MKCKIIRVPSHFGAPKKGTHDGPKAIFEGLGLEDYSMVEESIELKINQVDVVSHESRLQEVVKINTSLKHHVLDSISKGLTPIVLHGDDSSIMGTGFGLLEAKKRIGVIYFDAHGDINSPKTSLSGFLFGMGLSHLIGNGYDELLKLANEDYFILPKNICLIGTRNLDPGEELFINNSDINLFGVNEIRKNITKICEDLLKVLNDNLVQDVYIHIDQDVIDPLFSGASLCQEKDGLFTEELYYMLSFIKSNFNVSAISLGNYLPSIDYDKKTLNIIENSLSILGVR